MKRIETSQKIIIYTLKSTESIKNNKYETSVR